MKKIISVAMALCVLLGCLAPLASALPEGGQIVLRINSDVAGCTQKDYEKIKSMDGIHIIGYVTEEGMPAVMVTPQNTTITLRAQAFQGVEE